MKSEKKMIRRNDGLCFKPLVSCWARGLFCCLVFLALAAGTAQAQTPWPQVAISKDGTPISYEVFGQGEPTLVFVHGWSCDARYWRMQVAHFSKKHRVIVLDLAGHGHSGLSRKKYTMSAFGEDVQSVVDAAGGGRTILIGHSMGGFVIAEAARLMPSRVIGLIGVDTLANVEYPLTLNAYEKMVAPLKEDFVEGSRGFVASMVLPDTDPALRDWIISDMSSAPPAVAMSAMEEMMNLYITKDAVKIFQDIRVPVVCVNADLWPVNVEANRRHMRSFDAIVIPKADHFLMMNQPEVFNPALEKAIGMILGKSIP